jgi:hypothetical protein
MGHMRDYGGAEGKQRALLAAIVAVLKISSEEDSYERALIKECLSRVLVYKWAECVTGGNRSKQHPWTSEAIQVELLAQARGGRRRDGKLHFDHVDDRSDLVSRLLAVPQKIPSEIRKVLERGQVAVLTAKEHTAAERKKALARLRKGRRSNVYRLEALLCDKGFVLEIGRILMRRKRRGKSRISVEAFRRTEGRKWLRFDQAKTVLR